MPLNKEIKTDLAWEGCRVEYSNFHAWLKDKFDIRVDKRLTVYSFIYD